MSTKPFNLDTSYTQNRELSWLRFNERVLAEAADATVPLFERLKFAAIFTSNLDEFFMIRVGSLFDLSLLKQVHIDNKTGMTPEEQLRAIYDAVAPLYKRRDKVMEEIEEQLRLHDITRVQPRDLIESEQRYIENYYRNTIRPVLSPQIVDQSHPFPHLINKARYVAVRFHGKGKEKEQFGLIPVPDALPRVIFLPGASVRYILLEQVLLSYTEDVFSMYTVSDKAVICVTRNADINPDDENFEVDDDYRHHMKRVIKKRARLACVRLELFGGEGSAELREFFMHQLSLKKEQVFKSKTPLDLSYVYGLSERMTPAARKSMSYRPFKPMPSAMVNPNESITRQVMKRDLFLSYPYESMEPFLKLVEEAAVDPAVVSIKITIYRLASSSRLVEALTKASENGKDVVALLELRARFDEQNNINWSETLEDAGCQVIYGMEDYKVHSKICLITRQEKGKVQYLTQIGTGNYNEKTAKLYTDFCLMTSDPAIGQDASEFFKNMALSNLEGTYRELMVAPNAMQSRIIEKIDEMTHLAQSGQDAHMIIKTNSVTDRVLIDRLQAASDAGVKIQLIVRGICCILPQIPGKTENITVTSVVGRFLEHSRVYCFMANGESEVYISSADFMTRNMTRRVEIACPVKSAQIKQRLIDFLMTMLHDNVKARRLMRDGTYLQVSNGEAPLSCQDAFMQEAEANAKPNESVKNGWVSKMFSRFKKA